MCFLKFLYAIENRLINSNLEHTNRCKDTFLDVCVHTYVYIVMYREREREIKKNRTKRKLSLRYPFFWGIAKDVFNHWVSKSVAAALHPRLGNPKFIHLHSIHGITNTFITLPSGKHTKNYGKSPG